MQWGDGRTQCILLIENGRYSRIIATDIAMTTNDNKKHPLDLSTFRILLQCLLIRREAVSVELAQCYAKKKFAETIKPRLADLMRR